MKSFMAMGSACKSTNVFLFALPLLQPPRDNRPQCLDKLTLLSIV